MSEFLDNISQEEIIRFCQKWQIREFALFGSVVGEAFKLESDIDVLVTFNENANWGLFDHAQMRLDLEDMFKRKVDLVTRRALEQSQNDILRERILTSAKTIYSNNEVVYAEG